MDVYVGLKNQETDYKYEKVMTFDVLPRIGDEVEFIAGQVATVTTVCHCLGGKPALILLAEYDPLVGTSGDYGWEEVKSSFDGLGKLRYMFV